MWALDTDTLTLWLRGQSAVVERVEEHDPDELAITIITVEEVLNGWYRILRQAREDSEIVRAYGSLQQAVEFMKEVRILSFNQEALDWFHNLRARHSLIGTNDLRIAAIVLERGASQASRNLRDFRPITGLEVQDWSA